MNDNTEPNPTDSTLLDTEQIQMLIEAGASESMELVNELLDLYEGESLEKVGELKSHAENGDYEALSRSAHALSGSSANVGGRLVWQLTKQMENLCLVTVHQKTIAGLRGYVNGLSR